MRTLLIILALLAPPALASSPEQCGLKLQVAVGAEVSAEQIGIIIEESVSKDRTFLLLFLCLIAAESAFDQEALSGKQASGLTQTTIVARLEVQRRWTGSSRIGYSTTEPPLPIGKDIYFGSAYFALCLQDFNGNYPLALACYNAGPTHARAFASGRTLYKETANYISKIWKLYTKYCE